MNQERLIKIRQAFDRVTKVDWAATNSKVLRDRDGRESREVTVMFSDPNADIAFIEDSKQYVQDLLKEVSRLQKELERQKEVAYAVKTQYFYRRVMQERMARDHEEASQIAGHIAAGMTDESFLSGHDVESPSLRALQMRRYMTVPGKIVVLDEDCSIEDTLPDTGSREVTR